MRGKILGWWWEAMGFMFNCKRIGQQIMVQVKPDLLSSEREGGMKGKLQTGGGAPGGEYHRGGGSS